MLRLTVTHAKYNAKQPAAKQVCVCFLLKLFH